MRRFVRYVYVTRAGLRDAPRGAARLYALSSYLVRCEALGVVPAPWAMQLSERLAS